MARPYQREGPGVNGQFLPCCCLRPFAGTAPVRLFPPPRRGNRNSRHIAEFAPWTWGSVPSIGDGNIRSASGQKLEGVSDKVVDKVTDEVSDEVAEKVADDGRRNAVAKEVMWRPPTPGTRRSFLNSRFVFSSSRRKCASGEVWSGSMRPYFLTAGVSGRLNREKSQLFRK
jgi:hypothetical protein